MSEKQQKQEIDKQLGDAFKNVSDLMSAPYEQYDSFIKGSTIGEMSGFRALLEQELTRVEVSVQELRKQILGGGKPDEKSLDTFGSLYGYIFRISDRLMMLHFEIKARMESLNAEFKK